MGRVTVFLVGALLVSGLAGCATSQNMAIETTAISTPNPKYRNAMAVGEVKGGQVMNILTVPGVPNEPFKAALESSHALAYAAKLAPTLPKDRLLLVNLSGRGDKDMHTAAAWFGLAPEGTQ